MKHLMAVVFLLFNVFVLFAQDEGAIKKRERIERDKNIFIGGGISILGGSNLGDYSTGINFEGGYSKRLNRVISVGGSISYLSFKYDQSILQRPPISGQDPANWYAGTVIDQGVQLDRGFFLNLNGGDISIISLAANIKVNLIPIKDNSVISVYGFAKPFISSARLSDLTGSIIVYDYDNSFNDWFRNSSLDGSDTFKGKSSISGGIFIGPGIEFFPTKPVSFFIQASFGYTFPIDVVSTRSYTNDLFTVANSADFPLKSIGFTSINFAGGISFNID